MPNYIVKGGVWGEGHLPGDVIELDTDAARVRLEIGDIELAPAGVTPAAKEVEITTVEVVVPEPEVVAEEEAPAPAAAEEVVPTPVPEPAKKPAGKK